MSQPTSSSGATAATSRSLSSAIATEASGSLTLNVPPNPQHRSAASHGTASHPSTSSTSRPGCSAIRSSRSMWQLWCRAIRRAAPAGGSPSSRSGGSSPARSASSSDSSRVRAPTARARRAASWSPTSSNSSGQNRRTIVAHDPAGTTAASAPRSSSASRAASVGRATAAASSANPAFQAG